MPDGTWVTPPATPEFSTYATGIIGDLQRELLQGIRVR
jgi:hypothetical protein